MAEPTGSPSSSSRPDPGRADPIHPDPSRPDSGHPDPSRSDPSRPDPSRPDSGRPDPSRPDPGRPDPGRPDPGRPDPSRPDPIRWLRTYSSPEATASFSSSFSSSVSLVCFPHAGGSAPAFRPWADLLTGQANTTPVSLLSVQYPGRLDRTREPAATRIADIAAPVTEILAALPGPFVLLGHSMGAVIAHDVAALLEDADRPALALVVAGREAPHLITQEQRPATDAELLDMCRELGGAPPELLEDEEMRELILAPLRADSLMLRTHPHTPARTIRTPILAFCGAEDPGCTPDQIAGWRAVTTGAFRVRMLPGGHFLPAQSIHAMLADVLAWNAPTSG